MMPRLIFLDAIFAKNGRSFFCAVAAALFLSPGPAAAQDSAWRVSLEEGENHLTRHELVPAEASFRRAVIEAKKNPGAKADDRAYCMARLAAVLQMQSISEDALDFYNKAIKLLSRAHGSKTARLLPDLEAEAIILENDGQYKNAIKLLQRAIVIASHDPAATAVELADIQRLLAKTYFKHGESKLAEPLYRSSLALLMQQKNLPSSDLLRMLIADYTDLLEKTYGQGKNLPSDTRGELLQDRLTDLPQRRGVPDSSFEKEVSLRFAHETLDKIPAAIQVNNVVQVAPPAAPASAAPLELPSIPAPTNLDDFAAAEPIDKQRIVFYQRLIAVDLKTLGPEHPSVARDLSGLAAIYMAGRHYDQAKILFLRALKIYEKVYGGDALLVQRTRTILELLTKDQAATQSGDTAGSNFVSVLPAIPLAAQKLDIAISLDYLALLCYSLGKIDDAQKIYTWSVADIYNTTGRESLLLAAGLKDYARVLRSAGNSAQAQVLESDAGAITRTVLTQQELRRFQ